MEVLFRFLEPGPFICVTSAPNLMVRVIPAKGLVQRAVTLKAGAELPMEGFVSALSALGYSRMSMVEERAEFSVRGGIVDLFSPGYDHPVRIEFFGDTGRIGPALRDKHPEVARGVDRGARPPLGHEYRRGRLAR